MKFIKDCFFYAIIVGTAALASIARVSADETLTIAIRRGAWETAAVELGRQTDIFQKHGIVLKLEYLKDEAAIIENIISKTADIGLAVDAIAVMQAYVVRQAAIRIIGASMAGSTNYWYVLNSSPIRSTRDVADKKVAYEANATNSHYDAIDLFKYLGFKVNLVPSGNGRETLDQLKSGKIDVAWASAPFGAAEIQSGSIRIVARANDTPKIRSRTTRVIITNTDTIKNRKDSLIAFLDAYGETIDWMYKDPLALKQYAELTGLPEPVAQRLRDEFYPKGMLSPDRLVGLRTIMKEAVAERYLRKKLSGRQLRQLVQVPNAPQTCELSASCPVGIIAP